MDAITGKLLGIVATIAVFVVAIMIAVYPEVESQGDGVGTEINTISQSLTDLEKPTWNAN